ncbi:uncharacterized protein UDID_17936 [Ustilago sp. UG-2017a]|nr:uncharacterized protein UDID_17936 [Ustilago sp. UG-2017a]
MGEAARRTKGGRKGKTVQRVQIEDKATDGNETEFFDNEAEEGSDSDNDDKQYDYRVMGLSAQAWSEYSLHGDHGHRGPGPYARRSKHRHKEDRAQGAYRWLPLRGSRDKSQRNHHWSKEAEQCIGDWQTGPEKEERGIEDWQTGPEEEEQCRRGRHIAQGGQEWC